MVEAEVTNEMVRKSKAYLDPMAQQVQNLLKIFYDEIEFDLDQQFAIKKAIIGITNLSGGSNLVKMSLNRRIRYEDDAVFSIRRTSRFDLNIE